MEKVIPRSINYSDIKPEAIENMVKLVRFTPTATVNNARSNDIVRFQIQGNSFFDPYSSYIRIEVTVPTGDILASAGAGDEFNGRFLDRSAHSFINRLVVKSEGTELERIEHYDVAAAMINDMLYSQEEVVLHHYEGFPQSSVDLGAIAFSLNGNDEDDQVRMGAFSLEALMKGEGTEMTHLGDQGFWSMHMPQEFFAGDEDPDTGIEDNPSVLVPLSLQGKFGYKYQTRGSANVAFDPVGYGARTPPEMGSYKDIITGIDIRIGAAATYSSDTNLIFCIPIYSGIIGVLEPDRKLLPLSLMPLEVEFTLNPYAFYDVGNTLNPRQYTVTKFWIYTHVMTFEEELHRSLEAVVAENGIFIHFNSFYLAPIATHVGENVSNYVQINVHSKSIQSVHFVYIYGGYEEPGGPRKLHFVNHNLTYLQVRNGTDLIPSEPISGDEYNGKNENEHYEFLLETYKGWGRMHDPTTDTAISRYSYTTDELLRYPRNAFEMFYQQGELGRCQYAISLEGEELGQDKQLISGRKGLIPFDINTEGAKKAFDQTSYEFIFTKADYLIYVRPDLVVTLLGK